MEMSRFFKKTAAALLLAGFLLSACGQPADEPSASGSLQEKSSSDTAGIKAETPILSEEQTRQIASLVLESADTITDPYLSGADIPVYSMTRFLYTRMRKDGAAEGFEQSGGNIRVPIETVREYADSYFKLDDLKVDFASHPYFDGQYVSIPDPAQAQEESDVDFTVGQITPGSGKVTVTLNLSSGGVLYQRWVYTLKFGADGNTYFSSMSKRQVEYGLYAINNAQAEIKDLMGIPVNSMTVDAFRFLPFGSQMLVYISNGQSLYLGLLGMDTYKIERYERIDLPVQGSSVDVQTVGDLIFLYKSNSVQVFDQNLNNIQSTAYAKGLTDQFDRYTGKIALSYDRKYLAFGNAAGLHFYNLISGETHLMQPNTVMGDDGVTPEMRWEPVIFNEKTNALLAQLSTQEKGVEKFGIYSTRNPKNALENTIRVRADADSLISVAGDWLMVFAPTSVRLNNVTQNAPLEQSCVEYNLVTGTPRIIPTSLTTLNGLGDITHNGQMLLADDYIYTADSIQIGEDMVSSYSVESFLKPTDGQTAGRIPAAEFGYVDRKASFRLLAASASNRVAASCSGMFIQSIVIF